jgi:hypothetical protein
MAAQALAYRQKNREHLAPSSPRTTPDFFTESYWAARLQTAAHEYWTQGAARFVLNGSWEDHVLTSLINPNAIEPS